MREQDIVAKVSELMSQCDGIEHVICITAAIVFCIGCAVIMFLMNYHDHSEYAAISCAGFGVIVMGLVVLCDFLITFYYMYMADDVIKQIACMGMLC